MRPAGLGTEFDGVLAAARAKAPWAFERLYEALARPVLGYLRSQGARDAEDLMGEVFLRVFRRLATFEGDEAHFRSWVFAIAHNLLIDERRGRERRPCTPEADPAGVRAMAGGNTEDDALAMMAERRVREVLDRLAPDQRDVLLMRIVSDLTVDQVAAALGKTPGAVKALQHRGLEALRHLLERKAVSL